MAGWFEGRVEGGPQADEFVARIRSVASAALTGLVAAEGTSAIPYGCVIGVCVPGVPPSEWPVHTHLLQVRYEPGSLRGYWGCSHIWDDYEPDDPEAMNFIGELSAEQAAERAVAWLVEQLRRPLVRQEWKRRLHRRGFVRWVLADTGRVVAGRRRTPKRRPAPDRYVEL